MRHTLAEDTTTNEQTTTHLQGLADALRRAPGNAVIYSDSAWAVARKGSGGGADARWFPDHGAHHAESLSVGDLILWTDDWVLMTSASDRG